MCLNYHHCLSNEVTQNPSNFKTVTSATNIHKRNDQNGNEKRHSTNSNNGNGIANGVNSYAAHGLYQGVLYYRSLVRFHATHLNVIPFKTIRKVWHAIAQLVETLRYKPEGRGFDSRWCHLNFSLTQSFRPHYGLGVDSASNRNEYQEYFLGGKGGR